ncbi:androgen dependent TFPI regulating protein 1 [Salmo salar]|uniref:Androgen dependent TFPI regulating protein 1 n=1 Tax=Salmo salar TaxID=8030 RepID=A0A1S3MCH5_SALSA|nr:androgen dependent TFPI regulating protein 1 [Salmo salar]|eukprot:XP_014000908.1 PREDICTED: androgen-dependent TFPI-regulating protein-like isoform X1 [Salmo salar]
MATTMSWASYLLIHLVIFSWYVFTLSANCSLKSTEIHPGAKTFGGRWKYLTFLNLVLQTVFFGLVVLIDIIHLILPSKSLKCGVPLLLVKLRDTIFTILAFPIGTFVFLSFWSIYHYDREMVYPKFLDDIIPSWLNHALHTVILPLALLQMYIQPHRYGSKMRGILGLAFFSAVYLGWVLWVHHAAGIWVYPIMERLSPVGLVIFLGVACITLAPLYLLGEKLNHKIWRSTAGSAGPQKKKKK